MASEPKIWCLWRLKPAPKKLIDSVTLPVSYFDPEWLERHDADNRWGDLVRESRLDGNAMIGALSDEAKRIGLDFNDGHIAPQNTGAMRWFTITIPKRGKLGERRGTARRYQLMPPVEQVADLSKHLTADELAEVEQQKGSHFASTLHGNRDLTYWANAEVFRQTGQFLRGRPDREALHMINIADTRWMAENEGNPVAQFLSVAFDRYAETEHPDPRFNPAYPGGPSLGMFTLGDLPRDMREELFNLHATSVNPEASERGFAKIVVPLVELDVAGIDVSGYRDVPTRDPRSLPPVVIADGYLVDGGHRVAAAQRRGIRTLKAIDLSGLLDPATTGSIAELGRRGNPAASSSTRITVYHGTRNPTAILSTGFVASTGGEFGPGIYFSERFETASFYAEHVARGPEAPTVLTTTVDIDRFYEVKKVDWIRKTESKTPRTIQAKLKQQGMRGIIGIALNDYERQIVCFDATSIVGKVAIATQK